MNAIEAEHLAHNADFLFIEVDGPHRTVGWRCGAAATELVVKDNATAGVGKCRHRFEVVVGSPGTAMKGKYRKLSGRIPFAHDLIPGTVALEGDTAFGCGLVVGFFHTFHLHMRLATANSIIGYDKEPKIKEWKGTPIGAHGNSAHRDAFSTLRQQNSGAVGMPMTDSGTSLLWCVSIYSRTRGLRP